MKVPKVVPCRDLPPEISVGVQAFFDSLDEEVPENILCRWTKIPLIKLAEEVWSDPELQESHTSFESYHRQYKKDFAPWPPKWVKRDPNSIYPVILSGPLGGPYNPETGVLEDGWHRFHWYVDRWSPSKLIPVIWFVTRSHR